MYIYHRNSIDYSTNNECYIAYNESFVCLFIKLIGNLSLAFAYMFLLSATSPAFASRPTWVGVEIQSFAQTKSHPEVIYATDGGGLFKSVDRGQRWEPQKIPRESGGLAILVVPENHQHLVLWSRYWKKAEGEMFPLRYKESKDGGLTWISRTISVDAMKINKNDKFSDFTIDPIEYGGAWWVIVGNLLLRSADAGETWEINAEKTQNTLRLLHTPVSTYRLSEETLFRSEDRGVTWSVFMTVPVSDAKEDHYGSDLLRRADGKLLLRVDNLWYQIGEDGDSSAIVERGMASLPDYRKSGTSISDQFSDTSKWYCRIRQSENAKDSILAFCGWDNRSWPSRLCIHRSHDGGETWNRKSESLLQCHQDLPGWSPVSIWMDRADPELIIVSWMAGGVYRSEDGGESWRNSDQGLRFREPDDDVGFAAVHEPKLIRAVMERDKPMLEKLLAEGVNINISGNYVSGVLEADLSVLRDGRSSQAQDPLYGYLRSKGATPPPRKNEGAYGLMELVCRLNITEAIEDLIDYGYDWGYASTAALGNRRAASELHDCIRHGKSDSLVIAGKPLESWIARYVNAGKFPSADQVVFEMFENGRPDLALMVIKSASRKNAFDFQKTPPSRDRGVIFTRLLEMKEYLWAQKVFLSLPKRTNSRLDSEVEAEIGWSVGALCEPRLAEWYARRGVGFRYPLSCLSDSDYPASARFKMLAIMYSKGHISPFDWPVLLDSEETKWVENTREYRLGVEKTSGIIGVSFQEDKSGGLLIVDVLPDSPAKDAGLQCKDVIVGVNGTALTSDNSSRVSERIRGYPNTRVSLRIRRTSDEWGITLVRQRRP